MEVIGAGLGRTGTASLKVALEIVGFPCYHMLEVLTHKEDVDFWLDAAEKDAKGEEIDWDLVFKPRGYRAAVDHPACVYYKQLLARYPNAKVILTVRDSPEEWYDSARATIAKPWPFFLNANPFFRKFKRMTATTIWQHPNLFAGNFWDKDSAVKVYSRWVEEVKQAVPASQLLVFNAKQGWEPLCKFLGVPVPSVPFPRVNDRADFQKKVRKLAVKSAVMLLGGAALIGAGIFVSARFLQSRYKSQR